MYDELCASVSHMWTEIHWWIAYSSTKNFTEIAYTPLKLHRIKNPITYMGYSTTQTMYRNGNSTLWKQFRFAEYILLPILKNTIYFLEAWNFFTNSQHYSPTKSASIYRLEKRVMLAVWRAGSCWVGESIVLQVNRDRNIGRIYLGKSPDRKWQAKRNRMYEKERGRAEPWEWVLPPSALRWNKKKKKERGSWLRSAVGGLQGLPNSITSGLTGRQKPTFASSTPNSHDSLGSLAHFYWRRNIF